MKNRHKILGVLMCVYLVAGIVCAMPCFPLLVYGQTSYVPSDVVLYKGKVVIGNQGITGISYWKNYLSFTATFPEGSCPASGDVLRVYFKGGVYKNALVTSDDLVYFGVVLPRAYMEVKR